MKFYRSAIIIITSIGIAAFLINGCNLFTPPSSGSYIFLEARMIPSTRVLQGDSTHIGGVVCPLVIIRVCSYDTSVQRLTVFGNVPFPTENLSVIYTKFIGANRYFSCPSQSLTPLYHGWETRANTPILSVDSGGTVLMAIDTVLFRLSPHQGHSFTSRTDTVRGRYTIYPDTTTYPFTVEVSDVWQVRNYGYWPVNGIGFAE
jgi:hypothetical protein